MIGLGRPNVVGTPEGSNICSLFVVVYVPVFSVVSLWSVVCGRWSVVFSTHYLLRYHAAIHQTLPAAALVCLLCGAE